MEDENLFGLNSGFNLVYDTYTDSNSHGFVRHIEVSIQKYDNNSEERIEIGTILIQTLILAGLDKDDALLYGNLTDDHFLDAIEVLIRDSETKSKQIDIETINNYTYIDEFKLKPEYRGKGLGTRIMNEVLDFISKPNDLIVVLPYAIDDEKNKIAHNRVKRFWKSLDFKQFGSSKFYIHDTIMF